MKGPNIGDWLANGAMVIASSPLNRNEEFVVLAFYGGAEPYVTWSAYHDGKEWITVTGHYFVDITEAAIDFRERAGGDMREIKEWVDELVGSYA